MKKIALLLTLVCLLTLSGCMDMSEPAATALPPMQREAFTDRAQLYELYDKIDFNATAEELEAVLGPAVHTDVTIGENTSGGVSLIWERNGLSTVAVFSNGQIVAKGLEFDDPRMLAPLMPDMDFSKVHTIEVGATYQQIRDIMGCDGLEIMRTINREANPITQTFLMYWIDPTGSLMRIHFNQDGTMVAAQSDTDTSYAQLFEFPTIEPGATYAPTPTVDPEATPRPTAIIGGAQQSTAAPEGDGQTTGDETADTPTTEGGESNTETATTTTEGGESNTEAATTTTEGGDADTEAATTTTEGGESNTETATTTTEGGESNTETATTTTEGGESNTEIATTTTEGGNGNP